MSEIAPMLPVEGDPHLLRAIRDVSQLVAREKDRDRLLQEACESLIETRGYHTAWIALFNESDGLVATAQAGLGEGFAPMLGLLQRGSLTTCGQQALAQSDVVVVEDPASTCADCPLAASYSGRAVMTVRLKHGGKVYGLLAVSIPAHLTGGEEEQGSLKEVAGDITFALHDIELEQERKLAEEALRQERDRAQKYLDLAGVMFVAINAKGEVTLINQKGSEILGYEQEEIIGKDWFDSILPASIKDLTRTVFNNLIAGEIEPVEYHENPVLTKGGEERIIAWHNTTLKDDESNIIGTLSSGEDITERKQAEEALRESEQCYRALFDRSNDAVFILSLDSVHLAVNQRAADMLGYTREELIGKTVYDVVVPDEHSNSMRRLDTLLAGQTPPVYERTFRAKDGTPIPTEINVTLVRDNDGHPLHIQSIVRDITERKRAEKAVRDSRHMLQTVLDSIPAAVFWKDRDSTYLGGNRTWLEAAGLKSSEDVVGKSDHELPWEKEQAHAFRENDRRVMESGIPEYDIIEPYLRADGTHAWAKTNKVPLRDTEGNTVGVLGTYEDITERRRAEEVLQQRASQLALLNEIGGQVAALLDVDQVLDRAAHLVQERFGFHHVGLFTKVAGEERLVMRARAGEFAPLYPPDHSLALGQGMVGWAGQHGETLLANDVDAEPHYVNSYPDRVPSRSELSVPIRIGGEIVGVLDLQSPQPNAFDPDDVTILETLAGQMAVAINNARLYGQAAQRNRELTLLNRVIAATAAGEALEAILEVVCRELALAFEVPQAAAALFNKDKSEAVVVAEYLAPGRPPSLGTTIPAAGNPASQHLLTQKTPLVIEDAQTDPRQAPIHDLLRQRGTVSLLLLPLVVDGDVVGSLGVDAVEPRAFSAKEVNLAWRVAEQVSGVLARARLREERQQLEEQFHQAQKMEAIGRLAGGVAHDFNNLLTVIHLSTRLVERKLHPEDPLWQHVQRIQDAGRRATDLTRQLLAFSRREIVEPQVLNLNQMLGELDKMLQRLISEDIELTMRLADDLWPVEIDPTQIEQVVVNLAVNAHDAMPTGGKLTIETANVVLDEAYAARRLEVEPGEYVMLAVSDNGVGMSDEVKARVFEPFFTTKERGKGTGLGLATAFGIVKQNRGHIGVYSEVGQGTTLKIYLPRVAAVARAASHRTTAYAEPSARGSETVLVVEDETQVRELMRDILTAQGYRVLTAEDGAEALQIAQNHKGPIHLLLTDVVMPRLSGRALADQLKSSHPETRVLYTSGYTDNAIVHHGVLDEGVDFLSKPFELETLAWKVRTVLDV